MSVPRLTQFCVHDNGGRPFRVTLQPARNIADISVGHWSRENNCTIYSGIWRSFEYERIFIGSGHYDVIDENDDFSYGNAVLLHVKGNKYIFVGCGILQFESPARIVKFVSTLGNSDVAYSFAVDADNRYYFFDDHVYLDNIPNSVNVQVPGDVFQYLYSCNRDVQHSFEYQVLHDRQF
jgi:hypothetical protein